MNTRYNDMYALFRHEPGAEEYFDQLPGYVQDQIRPRYQAVDSFSRLESYAAQFQRSQPPVF